MYNILNTSIYIYIYIGYAVIFKEVYNPLVGMESFLSFKNTRSARFLNK